MTSKEKEKIEYKKIERTSKTSQKIFDKIMTLPTMKQGCRDGNKWFNKLYDELEQELKPFIDSIIGKEKTKFRFGDKVMWKGKKCKIDDLDLKPIDTQTWVAIYKYNRAYPETVRIAEIKDLKRGWKK